MEVFLESIVQILDKINAKYKKILNNSSSQNKVFFPPKVQKNTALRAIAVQHIFNKS